MNLPAHNADPRRWLVLAITASGLFLICVDLTVLYVALPALTRDLAASNAQRLWILNAYPIVVAGLLPGLGTLGDRYGHRRLFIAGLIVFGLASLAAAFSPNAPALIAGRAGLGVGAGLMMPATLAIIRNVFTAPRERALAIGLWAGSASGGMALGPLVAGLLLEKFWWGSVFLINVPVVLVALVLTLWLVPRLAAPGGPRWDVGGSLLLLGGLTAAIYAIKEVAKQDFSPLAFTIALLLSALCFVLYLRGQRGRAHPLLDLSLFRLPDFAGAFAAACLGTTGTVGLELILSQHLQLVEQRTPLAAALVMTPLALGGFVGGPLAGRLMHRLRPSAMACGALALAALCIGALALLPPVQPGLAPARLLLLLGVGLGIGGSVTFASSTIMNAAPPERGGMAASIEEVGFELGGSLGVALFGSLMTIAYAAALMPPETAPALPSIVRDSLDEALRLADSISAADATQLRSAAREAFTVALRTVLLGIGLLWMVTGIGIARAGRSRRRSAV
ncbi:MAG: MFS transporter [Pseudomonadota bacterium]|nr:MFS transporter [Pseudomonadota bacterium]